MVVNSSESPRTSVTEQDLVRWSETLSALARTGLAFSESGYERERYEEVLLLAAEIAATSSLPIEPEVLVEEWTKTIGHGVPGYVTPKNTVGAIVGNDDGELLLVQRSDSGVWLYPTGWADIGYHFVVDPSGRVWAARPLDRQGAHVKNENEHNLGILVLGNFEVQTPTPAAMTSLDALVVEAAMVNRVPLSNVRTHREWNPTACPGASLQAHMNRARSGRGRVAQNLA